MNHQVWQKELNLEEFPFIIAINQKIIKYILYSQNNGNDSIVKQIFL